jgi:hypothetical protein
MSKYKPETPWQISDNLVYNLKQDGWIKGEPFMVNDVAVSINARHLDEKTQKRIAGVISSALNEEFYRKQ